jgi:two-component system cell cycle response regulator
MAQHASVEARRRGAVYWARFREGHARGFEMKQQKTVVTVISKITDRPIVRDSCLVVIYGEDLGKKHALDKASILIGRSSKSDIQIDQESISRNHAKIVDTGKAHIIRDLGSTNGTYVNDGPIAEHMLRDGDLIKIGHTIFKFLSGNNIENSYHEEIYRLTTVDGLTQVYNKRYFVEMLEREISRCHRYGRHLTLILFDLDHFKQINDTYGHLAGDFVLKQVAQVIKAKIRREDLLARYGGEEFAILLPEIDPEQGLTFAEKIRQIVENYPFVFEETRIRVAVSLGVASVLGELMQPAEFIKRADEQLYRAKRSGRNRVCS